MKINNTSSIEDLEIALGKIKENEIAIKEQFNNNEREKRLIYLNKRGYGGGKSYRYP